MDPRPFWETAFEDVDAPSPFGPPSQELVELLPLLPKNGSVLDLGCGDGRNTLFFARHGCKVKAVDISPAAISKLSILAEREHLAVNACVSDLRDYHIYDLYDLIIAHGCLHLLDRSQWARLLAEAKHHTRTFGYHVVVVFTDTLPPPEDLSFWMKGLFKQGELFELYSDWSALVKISYVLDDEHPGGVRHRHAIDKLVVQFSG